VLDGIDMTIPTGSTHHDDHDAGVMSLRGSQSHANTSRMLLPPRCLEDQEGLTVSDDQASDLDLLGNGGGIEPATSGL